MVNPTDPTTVTMAWSKDPLSQESRKNRRALLALSVLALSVTYMKLIPTRVTAFGIELSQADQATLQVLLLFMIVYFMVTFLLSLAPEYIVWFAEKTYVEYRTNQEAIAALERVITEVEAEKAGGKPQPTPAGDRTLYMQAMITLHKLRSKSKPLAVARIILDAAVPVILAIISISGLACAYFQN